MFIKFREVDSGTAFSSASVLPHFTAPRHFLQLTVPLARHIRESLERLKRPQVVAGAFVPRGVVVEVQLVVLLGGPPLAGGGNLGDDGALPPLGVGLGRHLARRLFLLGVVVVDGGAVLRSRVRALGVERGGVVELVEELEELAVRDLLGVKDDLRGFGVCVEDSVSEPWEKTSGLREENSRPVLPPQTAR